MNTEREEQNDELGTPTDEVIASFIWCEGHICVSYYKVSSLDLYITYETVDLRPDFCHLKNLFRIMPNMRNVIASGPDVFLKAVMKLLDLPEVDPTRYRLHNLKTLSAATFVVYTSNDKTLIENRKRILEMHMPRMTNAMTDQDRFNFIETVIPLHQTLVVQCLGNLLHFLDANWRHLFLREETRPVVSDVQVYKLDGNVLIDDSTFSALQVTFHIQLQITVLISSIQNERDYHFISFKISFRCLHSKTIRRHSNAVHHMHRLVITVHQCTV